MSVSAGQLQHCAWLAGNGVSLTGIPRMAYRRSHGPVKVVWQTEQRANCFCHITVMVPTGS